MFASDSLSEESIAKLEYAYKVAMKFLRRKYVSGISIGSAFKNGKDHGIAICIHVVQKKDERNLRRSQIFPKEIEGVRVDIIQSKFKARSISSDEENKRRRLVSNPLVPGVSITASGEVGTLGMFVTDRSDANMEVCILTASHVLEASEDYKVYQPGEVHPKNFIGYIKRGVNNNNCDAAIITLETHRSFNNMPLGMQNKINGCRKVRHDDVLYKSGCVTGVTSATVSHIGRFLIEYATEDRMMSGFILAPVDSKIKQEISDVGDSGAIWFDKSTGEGVGLTVAGDRLGPADSEEWAFACHLSEVFDELNISHY